MARRWDEIRSRASAFAKEHEDDKDKETDSQTFLKDFFSIFTIEEKRLRSFELNVLMIGEKMEYIDLFWKGMILIKIESRGNPLEDVYNHAKEYAFTLDPDIRPEYVMVCDFEFIHLYLMSTQKDWVFNVSQISSNVRKFEKMASSKPLGDIEKEEEKWMNSHAAEQLAKLHDSMKDLGYEEHHLEMYLVRFLFCLFAHDAGIFIEGAFERYIRSSKEDGSDLASKLSELFQVLDMDPDIKEKWPISDELMSFPYVNGGLFSERLTSMPFNAEIRMLLLESCTFDWKQISPAIFASMFQDIVDPKKRHEIGAHYTCEEHIQKAIKPLFLDALWEEFWNVKTSPEKLDVFHDKLASLTFLDPASGCGNFLIIAYRELRKLEFEVLKVRSEQIGPSVFDLPSLCKVHVNQFYGIEYESFPSQISRICMWLIDHQQNMILSAHFGIYYTNLPFLSPALIVHGNALRIDWKRVVPKNKLSYIFGNPPLTWARMKNDEQKEDMAFIFSDMQEHDALDYGAAWYFKAAQYTKDTEVETAFVSPNSIIQDEHVAAFWKTMLSSLHVTINFGYQAFKWNDETKGKEDAHCVIIGFDVKGGRETRWIFDKNGGKKVATNINSHLVDADSIFIERRKTPLSDAPPMTRGNQPTDNGHLLFTQAEAEAFLLKEPASQRYMKKFMMGYEFMHDIPRYCLWLVNCPSDELQKMPSVLERGHKVKESRLKSKKALTRDKAEKFLQFYEIRQPNERYIAIPKLLLHRGKYIPIAFLSPEVIAGDALFMVPGATIYHFGILASRIHMTWMQAVCDGLDIVCYYSSTIIYNTFPWPYPTDAQKVAIEDAAQGVLDARAKYPVSPLFVLYDSFAMPPELVEAHAILDEAVLAAYGIFDTDIDVASHLMELYRKMIENEKKGK